MRNIGKVPKSRLSLRTWDANNKYFYSIISSQIFSLLLSPLYITVYYGDDLEKYLQKIGRPISQKLALKWLKQLAEILDEIHRQQFFHRDIKPPNILEFQA